MPPGTAKQALVSCLFLGTRGGNEAGVVVVKSEWNLNLGNSGNFSLLALSAQRVVAQGGIFQVAHPTGFALCGIGLLG